MKKYEYEVVHSDDELIKPYSSSEDEFLKEKGSEGWELVSVTITKHNDYVYYFKREIL